MLGVTVARTAPGFQQTSTPSRVIIGTQADTQDTIDAQDRARAEKQTETIKKWAPWVIGAVIVGGVLYLRSRD
jgi:hypothetical protein